MLARSVMKATALRGCMGTVRAAHTVNMLLKQNVDRLGRPGDVVTVKAGYARNYLYPQKLAVYATMEKSASGKTEMKVETSEEEAEKRHKAAKAKIIKRLARGKLFFQKESVGADDILLSIEKHLGVTVGPSRLILPKDLTKPGEYTVDVILTDDLAERKPSDTAPKFEDKVKTHEVNEDGQEVPVELTEAQLAREADRIAREERALLEEEDEEYDDEEEGTQKKKKKKKTLIPSIHAFTVPVQIVLKKL